MLRLLIQNRATDRNANSQIAQVVKVSADIHFMAGISKRRQRKLIKKLEAVPSSPDGPLLGVVTGTTRGEWTPTMTAVTVLFGLAFVAALSQGIVLLPGGLFFFWMVRSLKPPRLLFVSPTQISVYSHSFVRGLAKDLVSTSPVVPFQTQCVEQPVMLGGEAIKLPNKEYERLVSLSALALAEQSGSDPSAGPSSLFDSPRPLSPIYQ